MVNLVISNGETANKGIQMGPWQRNGDDGFRVFSGSLRVRSDSMLFHATLCSGLGKVVCMEACVGGGPTQHSFRARLRSASISGEVKHRDILR